MHAGAVSQRLATPRASIAWIFAVALACALGSASAAHAQDRFFGADKAAHFALSSYFAVGSYSLARAAGGSRLSCLLAGLGVPLALGAGKELYDSVSGGDASIRDFAWDALGAVFGLAVAWLVGEVLWPPLARSAARGDPAAAAATGTPASSAYFFFTK